MSKIRINELARELEVKPNKIIELLTEFGVTEKKTHSSSIDEEIANKVRAHFGVAPVVTVAPPAAPEEPSPSAPTIEEVVAPPTMAAAPEPAAPEPAATEAPVNRPTPASPPSAPVEKAPPLAVRPATRPLRPPLATSAREAAPTPPPAPVPSPPPPATPEPPPAVIAAKPIPVSPKPGQILGPRQPLPVQGPVIVSPESLPRPVAPAPPKVTPPPRVSVPQPAPRPVVPPRPDIVARLAQQPRAVPGQPVRPPRPAAPVPGQPIYRGPIRPGQPLAAKAGAPTARVQRRPGTHPTAAVVEITPTEAARRLTEKRVRPPVRDREAELEEKLLRPTVRRAPEMPVAVNRDITISEGITVKELSEKLGLKASYVIKKLLERKIFATINQTLDVKVAEEVARDFGATVSTTTFEEETAQRIEQTGGDEELVERPPVVTVMGHVDHGKTSLLDAIRATNVAAKEAGGITQHIGAYCVEKGGRKIVFIDTPGHEAFTRMRARGAKVTDIVILVVAADDGVMPQTLEAIDHARAAGVPIIVAINKIDKPEAAPERVKQQLADRGLMPEEWGGDVVMVPVSAKTGQNLDLLLEMVLLVADMQQLRANPNRPATATVLEAKVDRGRGPVATVIVRQGTLRVGDHFLCGTVLGKIRALYNDRGEPVREAGPSIPVEVLGLEALPEVGDTLQVMTDTAKAKQIVMYRESKAREQAMARTARVSLSQLHEQIAAGEVKDLPIILKTDVSGTAEVLSETLQKLSTEKVRIVILHAGVGAINENDVMLASASNAIIVGFNVRPERSAAQLAEQERVDIRLHTIIYELVDEIKRAMTGMLEPVYREVYKGRAEVRQVFHISKVGNVAGCAVLDGVLSRDSEVRLLRDNVVVYTGRVASLRRFKNDVSEVKSGMECGVALENFGDIKPGDIIEAFVTERVTAEALV
ncbi:MAG: translation initiation factor IF-2 [Bryobacterales bacterium]|nr:translation initiation factor IF-2 [Bryobacterales bacterium]